MEFMPPESGFCQIQASGLRIFEKSTKSTKNRLKIQGNPPTPLSTKFGHQPHEQVTGTGPMNTLLNALLSMRKDLHETKATVFHLEEKLTDNHYVR